MNRAWPIALLLVTASASVARADDDVDVETRDAAELALSRIVSAVNRGKPAGLVALMDRRVAYDLDVDTCGKAMRGADEVKAKARLRLARCMLKLDWPSTGFPVVAADHGRATLRLQHHDQLIVFAFSLAGPKPRLIGLRYGAIGGCPAYPDLLGQPDDDRCEEGGVADGVEGGWYDDSGGLEDGEQNGIEGGVEGGVVGGQIGGVLGGTIDALPPPPPPPPSLPPPGPMIVSRTALAAMRSAGDADLQPDAATRAAIRADGKRHVIAFVKLCLDRTGAVSSTTVLKSSGYPAYDRSVSERIRTTWRFRPFQVNGSAAPVCAAIPFTYDVAP